MAQRDKYNFTQQTDLWGVIKYSDVPSYSSTSVGSTGNAYLVRNFLKKFFPFLDCTVNKTSGGSVNVKIQKFTVKFTFTEAGITKQFILDARSLEGILEPLFEGQGFDGMTDSTYSIPLPKMYNDDGQDVSYGYGYLFVAKADTDGYYDVDLDLPTVRGGVIKYYFDNNQSSSQPLKDTLEEIPQKTIEYIKLAAVANTNAASPTTNQSDLVILERGEENPNPEEYLVIQAENVLKLLNRGTALSVSEMDKFSTIPRLTIEVALVDLLKDEYVVIVDKNKKRQKYEITQKGKNALEKTASKINPLPPARKSNDPSQYKISFLGQAIVDFLAENTMYVLEALLNELTFNKKFRREDILDEVKELIQNGLVSAQMKNGYTVYVLTSEGSRYLDEDKYYTVLKQLILDFLAAKKGSTFATKSFIITQIRDNNSIYTEFEIKRALNELVEEELIGNKIIQGYESYFILPKASSDFIKKQNPLISKDPNDMDMEKSSEGEKAMSLFVAKNLDVLQDMEQNAPELLDLLSKGIQLITNLDKANTAELAPFTPLKNQQELEEQFKEEDFDISESDLSELDLTGLEDDLELNDDELGNLDLTEFDELTDFVESELIPSKEARDYAVLKTLQLKSVVNNSITTNEILTSLNDRAEEKYTDQNILDLEQRDFLYKSNGWNLTSKGEDFIDEYELKNKQDSVAYPLINSQNKIDIENLDALQKNILMILDKPPAKGKGIGYNEMDQSEIWAEVDETIAIEYSRFDVQNALDVLIGLKLVTALNGVPVQYRLTDDKRTSETIANIKNDLSPLTPTVEKILRILYSYTGKLSAADIKDELSNMNIILPQKAIFSRLIALRERGLVEEINTSFGGIMWQITSLGNEYIDKLPKPKTGGEVREEKKQQKIEEDFGSLNYDIYLILNVLNENTAMLSAKTVTTILQQQFNKNPKWDEFEVLSKLRELLSMGLVLEDTENSTEYFEISAYGEDVVKYLIVKERKGDYPKSKPTKQTVGVRPSPTESATLSPVGTIKTGNDGNNWQVKESSTGVKRWVKIK